jgi:glutaredoxin
MNQILIFTLNGCGYCVNLKNYFKENSIPFTEVEINSNREIWTQVIEQTGKNLLPTVFIKKESSDNGPVFVPSRDFNTPEELHEKLKIYL